MYDEEDDDQHDEHDLSQTLGEGDSPSSDVSAAKRTPRAPLDFSQFIPAKDGATPKEAPAARKQPLDFSQFVPKIAPGQVPLPRPRPAEAPAAETPYDPMGGMTIDPVSGQPIPAEPAAAPPPAPPPPPDMTAPTQGGFPAPQPLDDQPFRSGGTALDAPYGAEGGMLSGKDAYDQQQARIKKAEQDVAEASTRRDEAKRAHDEALVAAKLSGQAGDVYVQRQINQRIGFGKATMELQQAEKELQSAIKAPLPTQDAVRDTLERVPGAAVDQATQTARAAARIGMVPIRAANEALTSAMGTVRPALNPLDQADKSLDEATKAITDKFSLQLFKKDEAQNERLGSKVVQGVVSTAMFAATGLAGRAAGLSPALTTAIAGALPQAEGQFQQAQRAQDLTPGYAAAWMKHYTGANVSDETANAIVKWSMFVTGLGIGATEAVPVAHLFERMEKISGGGVTRWIGLMAAQAGEEGLQEAVQQLLENAAVKGLLDPNRKLDKEVVDNALVGAISGALVSGTMAAPAALAGRGADPRFPAPVEPAPLDLTGAEPPPPGAPPVAPVNSGPAPVNSPSVPSTSEVEGATPAAPGTAEPAPTSPVTATERRTLRKKGYVDEQIDAMSRAEAQVELAEATEQGISDDEDDREARDGAHPGVSNLESDQDSVLQSERDRIREVRRGRDNNVPGVDDELSGVLPGGRAPADANTLNRQDQERPGVRAGERPLGDTSRTERKSGSKEGLEGADASGRGADTSTVVKKAGDQSGADHSTARGGVADTGRSQHEGSQERSEALDFSHLLPDGSRATPVKVTDAADLVRADAQVAPEPTPGQRDAENYRMAHLRWPKLGRVISVETAKGGTRTAADGSWSVPNFPARYGRIKGTLGADGQQVDAFMGEDVNAPNAFIVDQYHPETGKFDEHKVMLGFPDQQTAERVYDAAFTDGKGPARRGAVTAVPIADLKKWLKRGKRVNPFSGPKQLPQAGQQADKKDSGQTIGADEPSLAPGHIRLYRGETEGGTPAHPGSAVTGGWFTTDRKKAEGYGPVKYLDVALADKNTLMNFAQGHGGVDEFVTDNKEIAGRAKPLQQATKAPTSTETVDTTTDAAKAVDDALAAIGIPSEAIDPADHAAATKVVAETGATPQDAFQQVMEEQIKETTDAADSAATVPVGVEEGESSGQQAEGELVPGRSEDGGEAGQGRPAAESTEPDRTGDAEDAAHEPAGDAEKTAEAADHGVASADTLAANKASQRLSKMGKRLVGKDKAAWEKAAPQLRKLISTIEAVFGETDTTKSTKSSLERLGIIEKDAGARRQLVVADQARAGERGDVSTSTTLPTSQMTIEVGGKRYPVGSFKEASEMVEEARDTADVGASKFPTPRIIDEGGKPIAYVSYNGRVWADDPNAPNWKPGAKPLYDNAAPAAQALTDARDELTRHKYMVGAVREIVSLTQGGPEAVQKAIERDASDNELVTVAARAGWGGKVGGAPLDRGTVEGRGKVVTVLISPYGKDIEIKGEELAEMIREAFPDVRLTEDERAAIETFLGNSYWGKEDSDVTKSLRAILERGRTTDAREIANLEAALKIDAEIRHAKDNDFPLTRNGVVPNDNGHVGEKDPDTEIITQSFKKPKHSKIAIRLVPLENGEWTEGNDHEVSGYSGGGGGPWVRAKGKNHPSRDAALNAALDELAKRIGSVDKAHGAPDGAIEGATSMLRWVENQRPAKTDLDTAPSGAPPPSSKTTRTGSVKPRPEGGVSASGASLADTFVTHLRDGGEFKNILAARKMAKEAGFDGDAKAVEEAMELAVVTLARQIVRDRSDPNANFTALVDLYSRQPKLGTRTSTSMRDQAFSTPVPLAYVASRLAQIGPETTVLEPTAGNGALLIEATPSRSFANEINEARANNLRAQGFRVSTRDAAGRPRNASNTANVSLGEMLRSSHTIDRVIANPPFGAVRQEGESKVYDLGDIQKGYQTKEIDHAIALRALQAMKDDGRAVLLIGGVNKQAQNRSDAYNGKSKREFFKVLYDRYNVVDHFTTSGDLWERQGAGWPVDVIVIDGRGKSERALPAVDVPRILTSWDQLGGLIDAVPATGRDETDRASDGAGRAGPGERDGRGRGDGERVSEPDAGAIQSDSVQPGPVQRSGDERTGDEGRGEQAGAERGDTERAGDESPPERRPPGLTAEEAVDAALEEVLGPQAGPKSSQAPAGPRARTTTEVAKSAATNAAASADAAFSGLYELFGGGKTVSMGVNFDEATYAKAKPLFMQAAEKFAAFKNDIGELAKRMVTHMRDALKWPNEAIARMRPYLVQFIKDVQSGAVSLVAEAKPAPRGKVAANEVQETDKQVTYAPQSKSDGLGTLVPVNMRHSISDALAAIEKRVGSLDTYVAKELGYKTDENGSPYFERGGEKVYPFAAEQIDAIALGIENIERGKGFIIGDQTGIGKGRVNAAILRYAMKKGYTPIFVTAKPNLYGDMYRDLTDIGIAESLGHDLRILATNSDLSMPLTEDEQPVVLKTGDSASHKRLLNNIDTETFKADYDVVFTTYNQMQTVAGKDTDRRALLQRLAPGAVISFDESHEAGGQGAKAGARKKAGTPDGRSDFARDLIDKAKGVFYSSATYAKRPDVMDLYAATDMVLAVEKKEDLAEAIARGGVPMQQVVASMLAKAGQYIRRERSFAGVTYATPVIPVDHELYDQISGVLANIQDFSVVVASAAENMDADIKAQAEALGHDNATGGAGASSLLFTSVMHNVINQMLLALKAGPVAKMAIEALRRGEKPVITVANTMESLLNDVAEHEGLKPGDVFNADFGAVLTKYLDRTRTLIIKKPFSKDPVVRHYLTDEELGAAGLAAYNAAKARIENILGLDKLPASPIDRIKQDLANAGYKVGEITGRGTIIDYSGDEPVLQNRPGRETSIRGRRETISKFNSGALDAIVLNQAGATGLSLHASEKYKDQKQRHMMIAQAEGNIDTHMQMLGRVHRTGQVIVPMYSQLVADIPAEKRPAAVLQKKMASLNANTTASRGGALTAKDVPDFINQYGDMIAATIIADDPVLNHRLGNAVKIDDNGRVTVEDAMRRLTGRIPLLPLAEQEELYSRLEADYEALLAQMDASGENALEAKTLDLKARALERTQVVPAKSGLDSPFAAPVHIEKTSIARQGKPFSGVELMGRIGDALESADQMASVLPENASYILEQLQDPRSLWGGRAYDKERLAREDAVEEFNTYMRGVLDDIEDPAKAEKERVKLNATKDRFTELHEMVRTGARITLKTASGNFTAIAIKTERTGEAKNPLALSSWKTHFAVADAVRQVTLPFSRMYMDGKSSSDDMGAIELRSVGWVETPSQTIERFASMQTTSREERYIATGNLLAAYDWLNMKGRIINYTDEKGNIRQGILTPKDFDLQKQYENRARPIRDPAEVIKYMRDHKGETMWSEDNVVRMEMYYDKDLYITVEGKKRTGGVYYLDKPLTDITNDFYKRGGTMVANVQGASDDKIRSIIERMQKLGATFVDRTEAKPPPAEKMDTEEQYSAVPKGWDYVEAGPAWRMSEDEIAAVQKIVRKVAGIDPILAESIAIPADSAGGRAWGKTDAGEAQGMYQSMRDAITIALSFAGPRTAYHEAFHRLQHRLLKKHELAVLEAETERLRAILRADVARGDVADKMDRKEIEAEAFAIYSMNRESGVRIDSILRRGWSRLATIFRRLRNALNGLGYQTAEDIFGRAYSGEIARRGTVTGAAADRGEQYSLRRRAAAPGDVLPAPETMRGAWNEPGVSSKERLSNTIDAMLLTPSRALWDRQIDMLRFQKGAEAAGSRVPESLDTYLAASLYPGRAGERLKDAVRIMWEPLYDAMRDRGISRDDMQDYLYARHAPERNAKIREIDPTNDAGSGMTDTEAADIMGRLLARRPDFEALAVVIDLIVVNNRSVMLREGLESERTLDNWSEAYQHYVPLKGFEAGSDDELMPSPSQGRGFDIRNPESLRALGRFDRADDILANLLDQTQRTIIRAEKNRVAKTFLRFAQANPSPYYKIGLAEKKRRINPLTGLVEEYWSNLPTHLDRVFAAKVGGKTYFIEIKHPGLLEALKTLGADKMNPLLRFFSRLTREYSRFQTAKNPEFVFTNLVKDLQDAGFTLSGEKREKLFRRYVVNMTKGRALYGAVLGTTRLGEHSEARRWYEEWRDAGGKISHYGFQDLEQIRKEIDKELNQRTESTTKSVALALPRLIDPINGKLVKFLEALSDVTESTTRLAVYIAARETGLSKAEAARLSRNATVDFQRRGKYGTVIGALYAFAGANIQGNVRMMRTLRKSKIARRAAMAFAVAGMLMTYWNMAVSPEDEEKKKAYEKRKYWERERNILIYWPGSKNPIKIPLGYGLNVFWMMGEQLAMRTLGKVSTMEALGNVIGTMASAFNPFGTEGSIFDWKTLVSAYTPTVMRPIPDFALNRQWHGGSIHPDEMPWNKHLPHSDQHKAFTHPAAVAASEWINRITGGNKFEPGAASIYPDDIEYAWNFAAGGLGRFLANTSGTIADAVDGVDRPVERIPFVRRFVGSDNSPAVQSDAYYKKRSEEQAKAQRLRAAVKSRAEGTDDGTADKVIERLGQETGARPSSNGKGISVGTETIFRSADKQISDLRKQEDGIRRDEKLSRAERKEKIDGLRARMREIMGEARGRVPAPAAP